MASSDEYECIVRWLSKPQAYTTSSGQHAGDRRTATVERLETHISQLFLAGPLVYKLKKRVKYSFLDFSSLEARDEACHAEVRLNRRLAADWYIGALPITRDAAGEFQIDGTGQVVDWLVVMRRLPIERTLDALSRRHELRPEHIQQLVATLNRFHKSLGALPIAPQEYIERYVSNVRGNLSELESGTHGLPPNILKRDHGFQLQLLQLVPHLFEQRVLAGKIVEGHGDLRPEHICFTEPIAIFDCVEFNADLRCIDIADEIAFLSAECETIGADWVVPMLREGYQRQSHDQPPAILFDFYKSYRACVRAKVAALRADQLQGEARQAAESESRRHLEIADKAIQPWLQPLVVAVGGAAGTGKTTLAIALANALGATLLRTDVIRREIFGATAHAELPDEGIYGEAARSRVYAEMFKRAQVLHAENLSVVLDGTFATVKSIRDAEAVCHQPQAFLAIECSCRPEVAHARIGQRLAAGQDASEARPAIHELQRMRWERWPHDMPQIQIDTEQPVEEQLKEVLKKLSTNLHPLFF